MDILPYALKVTFKRIFLKTSKFGITIGLWFSFSTKINKQKNPNMLPTRKGKKKKKNLLKITFEFLLLFSAFLHMSIS